MTKDRIIGIGVLAIVVFFVLLAAMVSCAPDEEPRARFVEVEETLPDIELAVTVPFSLVIPRTTQMPTTTSTTTTTTTTTVPPTTTTTIPTTTTTEEVIVEETTTTIPVTTVSTTDPPDTTAPTTIVTEVPTTVQKDVGSVWDDLAQCESGGDWGINTGNGYYGGLQFALSSWQAVGGQGYPHENSREEQIYRAELLLNLQGWSAWPSCSRRLGLR